MSSLQGRRVLVTGGSGVIGRELLRRLMDRGTHVLSVDRLPLPAPLSGVVPEVIADLSDSDLTFVEDFDPEILVHLAASFERADESADFWPPNWQDNILCSHRLLDVTRRIRALRLLIFASSYLVYDPGRYLRKQSGGPVRTIRESDTIAPRNLCGAAKFYTEGELRFLRGTVGVEFQSVIARIFRAYGRGSRDVLSRWIRSALRGEELEVYHPENRFDYVYAGDVAEGLVRMAEAPSVDPVLNLGTGRARRVQDLVDVVRDLAAPKPVRLRRIVRDEPYEASRADLSRLRKCLGWTPPTTLEEGARRIWEYEEERLGRA